MTFALGVDTLCFHWRLEQRLTSVEDVLDLSRDAGCERVQVGLHHVRDRDEGQLAALAERADAHGIQLLASGDSVGTALRGETVPDGVARVSAWLERASALGSSTLRLTSGFYRAELAGRPELIDRERRHVIDVLKACLEPADARGVKLLLENHSDFSADEYVSIIEDLDQHVGVFLDLINPISAFEDPAPVVSRLAPFSPAGHVKDYRLRSIQMPDAHHRKGFEVLWAYPGEGVAPLADLVRRLTEQVGARDYTLTIEGLDNSAVADQGERIGASLDLLRKLLETAP